jgi:putative nucleotidyltransferase with HDIG domain
MSVNEGRVTDNGATTPSRRPSRRGWAWVRLILLGLVLSGVAGLVMVHPLLPTGQVVLEVGGVAPQDIYAPNRVTYESAILTAEQEEKAAASVEPVYTSPDPALARQQFDRAREVFDYLGTVRADALATPAEQRGAILRVPELQGLSTESLDLLLGLSDASWDRVQQEAYRLIGEAMRVEIREDRLAGVIQDLPNQVALDLSVDETAVAIVLVESFLVPNSFLDPDATAEAQARAYAEAGPVFRTFEAGQTIVREGELVTPLHIEALDQFGLRQPQTNWTDVVGNVLLALLGTALLCLYLSRFQPDVLWTGQQLLLLVLLVSVFVVGAGLMVPSGVALRYLFPGPALAMLVAATLGPQAGVAAALFLGGAAGVIADNSFELVTYTALGGIVAALTLGRVERIGALFRAGLFAALVHTITVLVFRLPQGISEPGDMLVPMMAGIANGGMSASLALGGLFLLGPLFDIVTTMRLIELSRPNHPLLQRLLREAPATYHHSLMVANLAEQAAERIGADPLLTRVGAYYHDVGKITRPYFFSENQVEGVNPHDRLDPRTSAEVIASHVKDGLDMARRYRLPSRVRAFIPEHHGTNWVGFLYDQAVELASDTTPVSESDFRHHGPKPQSKETALVMLADGCEAAVRAMRPTSAGEVAEVVSRVFSERVADGQLNESNLTLRELEITQEAFISALKGIFHPRIQYPKSETTTNM